MAKSKKKSFTIVEIAAIVSMVTLTGFLGFTYVNGQQKLASTKNTTESKVTDRTQSDSVKPADIQSIDTPKDLSAAYSQLDSMQRELDTAGDTMTLKEDLNSIIN